ncbi:MAG TPA: ATPase domain-containing protein [Longimicrobium sp.]|nr:ATPase domain-containing protein [Longimicrobium sp.]
MADGIVELLRHETGMRDDRFFRVRKLRGSSYREGLHALRLTAGGVKIYRRLVSPQVPRGYSIVRERVSTGVEGLDKMLGGGFWRGSTTLLGGPTGAGKTTIALQFTLVGVRQGEPGLYVHLEENPTQLCFLVEGFGTARDTSGLHLLYHSPVELQIDSLVDEMFSLIRERGVKRVVIDAVGDLVTAVRDPQRLHDYLYALSQHFAVNGVTAIFTFETARPGITGGYSIDAPFSHLSDNILLLEAGIADNQTQRTLRVIKTRGSAHDPRVREVEITDAGVQVL